MKLNLVNDKGESLIQKDKLASKEYHFFKFESEMKKVQISWKNVFTLAKAIGDMEKLDFEPNWTLVDIDNHLKGNPHISS
jgi:hypothetical protein